MTMTHDASPRPSIRPRWLTAHRLAQLGICVQFLAVVRTLAEFFRLQAVGVDGKTLTIALAAPYVGGALVAAMLTWAGVLCYFAGSDRAAIGVAGATIVALVGIKIVVLTV